MKLRPHNIQSSIIHQLFLIFQQVRNDDDEQWIMERFYLIR